VEYCVLGPVEAISEGRPVPIAAGKQRMLLCCLLFEPNRVVPADRLIDQLWGASPPATAAKNLQVLVSQLRKSLAAGGPDPIATGGGGYMLRVPPGGTDVDRFEQLLATARGQLAAGHAKDAALTLDRALSLWRGRPYEDAAYEDFARDEIARLEERRAGAEEDRADALLASGRHVEAVAGLETLVATHPYRERPIGQLMLALHRSGRRAEALQTFDAARLRFAEELGIDPGDRLRSLHAAMLSSAGDGEGTAADELAVPPGRRRRRLMVVGVCLVLAAVVAAAVAITRSDDGAHITSLSGNSLAVIDAGSGQVVAQYGVGDTPTAVASDGRIAWTLNADAGTVSRVDLSTGASIARSPGVTPTDLALGGGHLWVGYVDRDVNSYRAGVLELHPDTLATIRRSTLQTAFSFQGSGSSTLVSWGAGAIYATQPDGTIARLDPATLEVTATSGSPTNAFTVADDAVWEVPGWERTFGNQDARRAGSLLRLDPRTLRVKDTLPVPWTTGIFDLTAGAGSIWGAEPRTGLVWRMDPAPPGSVHTIRVGLSANAITFGDGAVWAADGADGSIVRIDPDSEQVTRISIGSVAPQGVAFAGGRAMVTVAAASTCAPMLPQEAGDPDLVIVSDLDLAPSSAGQLTLPMVQAIKDVFQRHGYRAGRFRIGYRSCDDSTAQTGVASAGKCQANARSTAEDASVVAVIGTFNSDCASAELPILNGAGPHPVPMISAANSLVGLTKKVPGALVGEPDMYSPTGVRSYFRVYPADDQPAAAQAVLAQRLGVHRVALLVRTPRRDPTFSAAQTSVQWFARAAASVGLPTVTPQTALSGRNSANQLARRLARLGVDAIAVDGLDRGAIDAAAALHDRVGAVTLWVAGPSSFLYQQPPAPLQHLLGPGVRLYLAATQIDRADQLPEAGRAFIREFGGPQPELADHAFVPYAAQAAETLLQAIADSDGSRTSVIEQLRRITVRGGILGDFGFDRNGDISVSHIPVYTIALTARGPTWRVVVVDVPSTLTSD
jgi:DNA-binding SARP family transcriptional activator/ABC-type branched-subunit amino acid transport system substrate-binding protein/DNA-binding beta-propeller fold protein YncE